MRKNKSNKVKNKNTPKPKKQTPFKDVGGILGHTMGGMFGQPSLGKNVGKWLGTGIGSIFGSGDYTLTNESKYNVLTNSNQIPKFDSTRQTNIVCHREYLGDITGLSAFSNRAFPINPGMSQTFPWLSTIAQNYQEYKIHGMIFEFRPLITDFIAAGSPGVVVMATNYNANDTPYLSRQQIENTEFATSVKPTIGLLHGIECAPQVTANPIKYVRTGAVGTEDLRLYDQGTFQFVSQGNPAIDLGELWVSYCIEFFKPTIPEDIGGAVDSFHVARNGTTAAAPLGTVQFITAGTLVPTVGNSSISFTAQPAQQYLMTIAYNGTASTWIAPGVSVSGGNLKTYWNLDTLNSSISPANGTLTTTNATTTIIFVCTLAAEGLMTLSFGLAGSVPSGAVDIVLTELSSLVTA